MRSKNGGFRGKCGLYVKVWVRGPQMAHPCAEPRLLIFLRQSRCERLGCKRVEEPPLTKNSRDKGVCEIAYVQKRNPLSDL